MTIVLVKSSIILCKLAYFFSFSSSKINIYNFCDICGYKKKVGQQILPLKTDVILKATEEKSWIRIRNPVLRISGSGSVSKCYGFRTLNRPAWGLTRVVPTFWIWNFRVCQDREWYWGGPKNQLYSSRLLFLTTVVESVDEFRRLLTEKSDRDEKLGSRIAEISRQVAVSPFFLYYIFFLAWEDRNRMLKMNSIWSFIPLTGTGTSGPQVSRMSRTQGLHAPSHIGYLSKINQGSGPSRVVLNRLLLFTLFLQITHSF